MLETGREQAARRVVTKAIEEKEGSSMGILFMFPNPVGSFPLDASKQAGAQAANDFLRRIALAVENGKRCSGLEACGAMLAALRQLAARVVLPSSCSLDVARDTPPHCIGDAATLKALCDM